MTSGTKRWHLQAVVLIAAALVASCKHSGKRAAPSPHKVEQSWSGCTVRGNPDAMLITCARPRSAARIHLPAMTEHIFKANADQFVENLFHTKDRPTRQPLTLADGTKAFAARYAKPMTDNKGRTVFLHAFAVGVKLDDGSGLFIVCSSTDDASCLADVESVYASPPEPGQPFDGGLDFQAAIQRTH